MWDLLTTREKVLILVLIALTGFGGLYQFYLVPTLDRMNTLQMRINQQEQDMGAAEMRTLQMRVLENRLAEGLEDEWIEALVGIPYYFNATDTLRLLQRVVYPHAYDAEEIAVQFPEPTPLGDLEVVAVTLDFATYRAGLMAVLNTLEGSTVPVNRVVSYTVDAQNADYGLYGRLDVNLTIEFLTRGMEPPEPEGDE